MLLALPVVCLAVIALGYDPTWFDMNSLGFANAGHS